MTLFDFRTSHALNSCGFHGHVNMDRHLAATSRFYLAAVDKIWELRDKIWEWPGDEANIVGQAYKCNNNCVQPMSDKPMSDKPMSDKPCLH